NWCRSSRYCSSSHEVRNVGDTSSISASEKSVVMCSLVSAEPSARGCGVCARRPSAVTRSDSFSTPFLPPWTICGSPLLTSAASVCSNLRSMAALMRGRHLAAMRRDYAISLWREGQREVFPAWARKVCSASQRFRRSVSIWGSSRLYVERASQLGTKQRGCAVRRGLELPDAFVRAEIPVDLAKGDAPVGVELGAKRPVDARGIPAEIDLVFDHEPAAILRPVANLALAQVWNVFQRVGATDHRLEHHIRRRLDAHGRAYRSLALRGIQAGAYHHLARLDALVLCGGEREIDVLCACGTRIRAEHRPEGQNHRVPSPRHEYECRRQPKRFVVLDGKGNRRARL